MAQRAGLNVERGKPGAPASPAVLAKVQNLIQRTLPVTLEIQRDVLESQLLEDGGELRRHFDSEGAGEFVFRDLDAHDLSVKAHAELAEAQGFDGLLTGLDGLDIVDGHRRPIRDTGTQ